MSRKGLASTDMTNDRSQKTRCPIRDYVMDPEIVLTINKAIRRALSAASPGGGKVALDRSEIVATTSDAALVTDEKGCIVEWNEAAERLLGHAAARALGLPSHEIICGTDVSGDLQCAADCALRRTTGKWHPVRRFELDVKTARGTFVRAALSAIRLRARGSRRPVFLYLVHPVDRPKRGRTC